ncbi:type II secretion system protein J [Glaciecola siphonariae]|uniref:Type II secretion system protein J n=1 Tax=Glaciecola siphonariae TaxID=521012 RepID=A0ABV9LVS8_9ALTE
MKVQAPLHQPQARPLHESLHVAKAVKPKTAQTGFTLIEVLVALVILSATFASVWAWLNSSSITTEKIATRIELQEASAQFLDYLSTQPLQVRPNGTFILKDFVFEYRSVINKRSDQANFRRQPAFIVGLFDVSIDVYKNAELVSKHTTSQVRYWDDPNYFDPELLL